MNICDGNRTATIEAAKTAMIKGTNIEDSPEEMKVLDSFLLRCWQMGWLDRYAPPRHFNALPKGISERLAAGHGSNVPMQPNIPPMPSNTSNALKALDSVNATQYNALDSISRQAAINAIETTKRIASHELHGGEVLRTFNVVLNSLINIMSLLPPANNSEKPNSQDIIHCKDCKYFKQVFAQNDNDGLCAHWHTKWDARTSPKGYCSYAERKQNDTERC